MSLFKKPIAAICILVMVIFTVGCGNNTAQQQTNNPVQDNTGRSGAFSEIPDGESIMGKVVRVSEDTLTIEIASGGAFMGGGQRGTNGAQVEGEIPEGFEPPEGFTPPDGAERPEGGQPPDNWSDENGSPSEGGIQRGSMPEIEYTGEKKIITVTKNTEIQKRQQTTDLSSIGEGDIVQIVLQENSKTDTAIWIMVIDF
jgi:hypothetical protein